MVSGPLDKFVKRTTSTPATVSPSELATAVVSMEKSAADLDFLDDSENVASPGNEYSKAYKNPLCPTLHEELLQEVQARLKRSTIGKRTQRPRVTFEDTRKCIQDLHNEPAEDGLALQHCSATRRISFVSEQNRYAIGTPVNSAPAIDSAVAAIAAESAAAKKAAAELSDSIDLCLGAALARLGDLGVSRDTLIRKSLSNVHRIIGELLALSELWLQNVVELDSTIWTFEANGKKRSFAQGEWLLRINAQ